MNSRAFMLSAGIALLAMFFINTYIDGEKAAIVDRYGEMVTVVKAKVKINELELIDDSKVYIDTVPRDFRMPGALTVIPDVENTVATVPIEQGEQITKYRVTYPGTKTGLSRQVSVGKRAIALTVNDFRAVGKLIKPGDRVDVIAAIDYSGGEKDKQKVNTLLQDIYVLSTGKALTNSIPMYGVQYPKVIKTMKVQSYTDYNTVTLEVTPFQVQQLIYLQQYSGFPIYLTLRNHADKEKVRIKSTNLFDVLPPNDSNEAKGYFIKKQQERQRQR